MAEPIEMQFGILNWVGPVSRECITRRCRCPHAFGMSGQLKSILKHRILGVRKRVSCAESGLTSLNDLYFVWVFLHFLGLQWLHLR